MTRVGSQLRQAREARGLSLEQAQKATRIKRVFLEAIEGDRIDELPGPAQARGFVRSYAGFLGLDAEVLLAQFDTGPAIPVLPAPMPAASAPARRGEPVRVRGMSLSQPGPEAEPVSSLPLPLPLLIAGAIILFIIGGFLVIRAFSGEAPAPIPTLPPNVASSVSATPTATPVTAARSGVSLTLTAGEHVWVRVTGDGFTAFEGILDPGQPQTWQADQQVIVETGNGAALNVAVNGQPMGVVGPRNRVAIRAWGPDGEVTPAPTAMPAAPTPATLDPTPTPTP